MKYSFRKALVAIGVVAMTVAGAQKAAAEDVLVDFTINPDPFSTFYNTPQAIIADKIIGNYAETFTVTGPGTFTTDAYYEVASFQKNDGTSEVIPGLTREGVDYQLYAIFTSDGTFTPTGSGGFDFVGTSGSVTIYVDRNLNTGLTRPADASTGNVTRTNFADDDILASAPLFTGRGTTRPGLNNGDFELIFSPFTLTAIGKTYFVAPDPFYITVNLAGQLNTFVPVGTQFINGSADAFFNNAVPEPASLTLLGLGLVGSAMARRRKKQA